MRTINKRKNRIEDKSIFLCKEADPDYLGREVYADNVETPYSFYLIRKLSLAKDYKSLAEGEAFFEAICDSWDEADIFEDLVVKKIYMYVETEIIYYTLLIGTFAPTRRELRTNLKQWLTDIKVDMKERALANNKLPMIAPAEMQGMMKQMIETTNEIFRLRKIINDLNATIETGQMEKSIALGQENPVISRSIRTIHLKRAQPLLVEEEAKQQPKFVADPLPVTETAVVDEVVKNETPIIKTGEMETSPEKKLKVGLAETELVQENTQIEEEPINYLKTKSEDKADVSNKELESKLKDVELKSKTDTAVDFNLFNQKETEEILSVDLDRLILEKKYTEKLHPDNWPKFLTQVKLRQEFPAPQAETDSSTSDLENLEDEIYFRFMNKRMRGVTKKNHSQKTSILRTDLLAQITQAEYLNYSWSQVSRQRKEDVMICGRLSSASLVDRLDGFLLEMKDIAYQRTFLSKKVRCPLDMLRRLEGYVLMDQYMQKLSLMSGDQ